MTDETTLAPLPWGRDVIESILPHRDPFVWVSRVVAIEPGQSITAELDVPADLDIFRGHFPDHPVLPGVIIMEALAQAASIAIGAGRSAFSPASTARNSAARWLRARPLP